MHDLIEKYTQRAWKQKAAKDCDALLEVYFEMALRK